MREEVIQVGEAALRLCCHDCFSGLRKLVAPDSLDVVVTSPPYNIGVAYGSYDDQQPREQYLAWIDEWAELVAGRMAEDGSLFLNVAGKPKDPWVPFEVAEVVRRRLVLQNVIHWVKSITVEPWDAGRAHRLTEPMTVGHFKPINSERFLNDCHEYIFHFTRSGKVSVDRLALGVPYEDKSNVGRWKQAKDDLRCRGNCWFIPYQTIQSRDRERPHPATFPPKLAEMCLRLHGVKRVELVCDPFLGLGSTAIACADLELPFIGFEIDEKYFAAAAERVQERAGLFGGTA